MRCSAKTEFISVFAKHHSVTQHFDVHISAYLRDMTQFYIKDVNQLNIYGMFPALLPHTRTAHGVTVSSDRDIVDVAAGEHHIAGTK